MADPIQQFQIVELVPLAKIGSITIAFTNSAFYMALAVALTAGLMLGATARRLIVFVLLGFAAGVLNVMRAAGIRPGGPEGQ